MGGLIEVKNMRIESKKNHMLLVVVLTTLILLMLSQSASAVSETGRTDWKLMKGVTESKVYAVDSEGKNIIIHILRIQKGANVSIRTGYKNYYKKNSTKASRDKAAKKWKRSDWEWSPVSTHAKEYESTKDREGKVIAAASMDFIAREGRPCGNVVMEGHTLYRTSYESYFAILKSGKMVIRDHTVSTADVEEAVGGGAVDVSVKKRLVTKGKVTLKKGGTREPRQAIGITAGQDLVIINIDGRDPISRGATLYDTAMIMKQQGCREALNMDGGGSAAFMTKRSSKGKLSYRNMQSVGVVRNVCSSLMIIQNKKSNGKKLSGKATVSMKNKKTALKKSSSGVYSFKINGKKQKGLFVINGKNYLFDKNGKGVTDTIKLGKTKYKFKKGRLASCSDKKAKTVAMGRCGAAKDENNLIFAYHRGNKVLNIGLNPFVKKNGKMKNWKAVATDMPWYAVRADIKKVYIGEGVTNIGNHFMVVSTKKRIDGTKPATSKLTTLSLPSTLKTIGTKAFYYKPKLKNLTIPASVKTIKNQAFAYSGKGTITFKSNKTPKLYKNSFKKNKFSKIMVNKKDAWTKYIKGKQFKNSGLSKKKVKYNKK